MVLDLLTFHLSFEHPIFKASEVDTFPGLKLGFSDHDTGGKILFAVLSLSLLLIFDS